MLQLILSMEESDHEKIETCLQTLKTDGSAFQRALEKSYLQKNSIRMHKDENTSVRNDFLQIFNFTFALRILFCLVWL